jgi:NAD(P)-dependent dehydrogenase (short-subunit alcohol dehydrogenase family)
VTGTASGIGEAIATAFIEAGALLCDLSAKTRPSQFEALDRHSLRASITQCAVERRFRHSGTRWTASVSSPSNS